MAAAGHPTSPDADVTDTSLPVPQLAAPEVELVACPDCGASNAVRRRRCGRCRAALGDEAAMEPLPQPAQPPDPVDHDDPPWSPSPPTPAPRKRWRRRSAALAVVAMGAVVGTGLGLSASMGLGPFATVEAVPFDPGAYPDSPSRLMPATAGSSSTAPPDGGRSFGPELTVDGDLTTAWIPDGQERGALLRHGLVAPVWVDRVEIATGDQHDDTTFAATARVTGVRIDLGTLRLDVTVAGTDGVQVIRLPDPVLTDEVTWEITATSDGVGAVSEIRYVGWRADEADREAFRGRQ